MWKSFYKKIIIDPTRLVMMICVDSLSLSMNSPGLAATMSTGHDSGGTFSGSGSGFSSPSRTQKKLFANLG